MFFNKEKFSKNELIKWGVIGGGAEVIYVILVGLLISNLDKYIASPQPAILGIFTVLTLLVISVAVSGLCVFGFPAYLAMQKQYKEALWTICATFATILISLILAIIIMIIFKN